MDGFAFEEREARRMLQELVRRRGTSLAALSRMLGRNPAYLQQYVARGSPRHLDEPDLRKLAQFLGQPIQSIATRDLGEGLVSPGPGTGNERGEWVDVPRLPLDASAGPGAIGAQEVSYDAFRFSRKWLRDNGLEGADLSAIRVEGDSMEPVLRSGDEIFVDRNKRAGDGIHVVRIDDALHVKQVQLTAPGRVRLVSVNSDYAPMDVSNGDIEIVGRVVWKGGRL